MADARAGAFCALFAADFFAAVDIFLPDVDDCFFRVGVMNLPPRP